MKAKPNTKTQNRRKSKTPNVSARDSKGQRVKAKRVRPIASAQIVKLLERISDGFVALDKNWRYVYVNQKAAEMLQRQKPSDLIGKHIWTEYPEGVGQPFHLAYEKAMKEQTPMVIEDYYEPWDRWFENRIYPSADTLCILFTEITERKQIEEELRASEARLQAAIDAADIGLWDWDLNSGQIIWLGHHDRVFGFAHDEFDGTYASFEKRVHPEDLEELNRVVLRARYERSDYDHEYRVIWPDGTIHWIAARGRFIYDEAGQPVRMYGAVLDRTEYRRAEEASRESEQKFSKIFYASPVPVSINRVSDGRYVEVNESFLKRMGYRREEVIGRTALELGAWADPTERPEMVKILKEHGALRNFEARFRTKSGEIGTALLFRETIELAGEKHFIGTTLDITERKRAEEELRLSETRYRAVVENQTEFIVHWKPDGVRTFANEAYRRYFGLTPEQTVSSTFMPLIAEEDRSAVEEKISRLLSGVVTSETDIHRVIKPDGSIGWQEWIDQAIHDETGQIIEFQSVGRDITQRKRTEEALAASETELRALLASMNDVVLVIDRNGVYRKIAPTNPNLLYKPPEELLGKTLQDVFPAEQAGTFLGTIRQVVEMQQTAHIEYQLVIDERVVWFDASVSPMGADSTLWMARDITERKRIEAALQESEKRYRDLVEFSPVAMTVHVKGRIVYINPAGTKLWGADKADEVLGRSPLDFVHPDYHERVTGRIQQIQAMEQSPLSIEVKNIRLDGQMLYTVGTDIPITYEDKPAILSVVLDITERVRAEERLRELTRRLVAAQEEERKRIAQELHDELGQALTAISLDLGSIEKALPPEAPPEIRERLIDARSLADEVDERISELALDLRPSLLDDLGLLPTLQWYLNRYSQRTGIEVSMDFRGLENRLPNEVETTLYRVIQEALTNIARHAQAGTVRLSLERSAAAVIASIQDDGQGFDIEEAQSSVASPGGVGLLGIKDRVSTLGGRVEFHSKPGQGTRIDTVIPL